MLYFLILRICIFDESAQCEIALRFVRKTQHEEYDLNELWGVGNMW